MQGIIIRQVYARFWPGITRCTRRRKTLPVSTPPVIFNFAYGSNMLSRRVRERVPSAKAIGAGILRGYELRWHKRGWDGSGKCDVVKSFNLASLVYGVVYEIDAAEKPDLDEAEGLGAGYDEKQVEVETNSGPVTAGVYFATAIDSSLVPYTWYKALVIAGAREHLLPVDYIARLEAVTDMADSNVNRAARHFTLVNSR